MNNRVLQAKSVLVTGGTGSFGSTFVRRLLADSSVLQIRVLSRDEKKQEDLRNELSDERVRFYIGDVRDRDSVAQAVTGVNYIFHAAALKQVPSCEFHPSQAIKTNVLGAENVMLAAIDAGVERAVFLSTDKAVNPINTMGQTKALMEKMVLAKSRMQRSDETILCCTRYGNVMCSRGSVIPLFIDQIKNREPITLTDSNMTRYMMSLDESVELVLFGLEQANAGDILVQKSPAATIGVLVEALQQLFGKGSKVDVIGMRHGEKLHETLISKEEMARATELGRYYRIPLDERDLNYKSFVQSGDRSVASVEEYCSSNADRLDVEGMKKVLLSLEYVQEQLRD